MQNRFWLLSLSLLGSVTLAGASVMVMPVNKPAPAVPAVNAAPAVKAAPVNKAAPAVKAAPVNKPAPAVKPAPVNKPAPAVPAAKPEQPAPVKAEAKEAEPHFSGEVTADRLNCRLAPSLNAAVGVVVKRGTVVEMTASCGNFIEIKAPADTRVYLSAVYLDGGKTIRELNLRTRPEPGAPVFMKLPAGTRVTKVADLANGWARIVPPESMRLYAARFYLKGNFPPEKKAVSAPAPVKAEEKKAVPAPVKVEEKKAAPAPVPAPAKVEEKKAAPVPVSVEKAAVVTVQQALFDAAKVAELKLGLKSLGIDAARGTAFETTAILTPLSKRTTSFVQYSLRSTGDELIAYVSVPDTAVTEPLVGRFVSCRGLLHAVPGWKTKVLEVESIKAR